MVKYILGVIIGWLVIAVIGFHLDLDPIDIWVGILLFPVFYAVKDCSVSYTLAGPPAQEKCHDD